MIVSASYRTDIPAFYGDWFRRRLEAGFCRVANPYGGPPGIVRLDPAGASAFVFWTRNPGPFMPVLELLHAAGRPFVVHFTITGYPRALEPHVLDPAAAVAQAQAIARRFGPRVLVWRYDPIVVTSLLTPAVHERAFGALAQALAGASDEVVTSFMQAYRKTRRHMDAAARRHGFAWSNPEQRDKELLLERMAGIAAAAGMQLTLCTQPDLAVPGTRPARCIDAERLAALKGAPFPVRSRGNRAGCACAESRDIGAYDSCVQGCRYCYAVADPLAARARLKAHDPMGEFLSTV